MEYLLNRNLNKKIIEEFQLGYVPWQNNFYEELLKKYSEDEINLTGLYYKNDKTGKFLDFSFTWKYFTLLEILYFFSQ